MIDFIKCFRQIDGAKVGRATTFDVTINNIADRADSEATVHAFFETKLIICSWQIVTTGIFLENAVL